MGGLKSKPMNTPLVFDKMTRNIKKSTLDPFTYSDHRYSFVVTCNNNTKQKEEKTKASVMYNRNYIYIICIEAGWSGRTDKWKKNEIHISKQQ